MARSITDIKAAIIAEMATHSEFNGMSTSATAIWGIFAFIIASALWIHETLWDLFRTEITNYIADIIPGSIPWYHQQCLNFQYGDSLEFIDGKFQYATIDSTMQIIKRCAVIEINNGLSIKLAKLDNDVPIALTAPELAAFNAYINQIKYAGTYCSPISYPADQLTLAITIVYDPLVLLDDGSLITDPSVKPAEVALREYIAAIVFGGVFNKTKAVDAMQLAEGVKDVIITSASGHPYGVNTPTLITQNYMASAGYMVIESLTATYATNV